MEWGIIFLIFFTPLAMGALFPWAYGLMEVVAFSMIGCWLVKGAARGSLDFGVGRGNRWRPVRWPLVVAAVVSLLAIVQVIPLPSWIIRSVSPEAFRIYEPVLGRGWSTLSLDRFSTWGELVKLLAYLGIFLIIVYYPFEDPRGTVKRICRAAMISGVAVGLLGVIQNFAGADRIFWIWRPFTKNDVSFYGPFVNPNHFAVYVEMIVCLFLGYIGCRLVASGGMKKKKGLRAWIAEMERVHAKSVLLAFLMVVLTVSLFFALSRGGIVILLYACALFFAAVVLRRRRAKTPMILGMLFLLVLLFYLAYLGIDPILKEMQTLLRGVGDSSAQARMGVWRDVWGMIRTFPVFGVGLGGFEAVFQGFNRGTGGLGRMIWVHAHNDYLQVWAELGTGGIILLCAAIFSLFYGIFRWVSREESTHRSREARGYLDLGFYVALVCFLIHALIDFVVYIPALTLLFFIIAGMLVRLQRRRVHHADFFKHGAEKRGFRACFMVPLGIVLALLVAALTGGFGGYNGAGDREFREKVLDEAPVARLAPLWHRSPYRRYLSARRNEKGFLSEGHSEEEKAALLQEALRDIGKAVEMQPTRGLFWERLGYLLSHASARDPDRCPPVFPGRSSGFGYRDAFESALYFSPRDAQLRFRVGSHLWRAGDPSGVEVLRDAIRLDPSLRRRVERMLIKGYSEVL